MKKIILAAALMMLTPWVQAEERRGSDLTYCLALPTPHLIAKCAGERSGGNKSKTLSPAQVEKILSEQPPRAAKERLPENRLDAPKSPD